MFLNIRGVNIFSSDFLMQEGRLFNAFAPPAPCTIQGRGAGGSRREALFASHRKWTEMCLKFERKH
jgi:hypothetical protein